MEIISRAEAKAQGLKRYFDGVPCKHGHVVGRRVSDTSCVECKRKSDRQCNRQWRMDHRERDRESNRQWRTDNPEYQQQWCTDNPEYQQQWRTDNPERAREHSRQQGMARRARKQNAPGIFTAADEKRLFAQQLEKCAECMNPIFLTPGGRHADHKIPLSRGGTNWPDNIRLTCAPCNFSKHNKTVAEHKAWKIKTTDHQSAGIIVRPYRAQYQMPAHAPDGSFWAGTLAA